MLRVKICGMTREVDVNFAILSGADAVGFIVGFPTSPRNITIERAAELSRTVPPFVDSVLVTTADTVKASPGLGRGRFDALQLYGGVPDPEELRKLTGARLIKAYAVQGEDIESAKLALEGFDALLTDAFVEGQLGGTGVTANWTICKKLKHAIMPTRLILSGGLTPNNVEAAVAMVRPFAVDVSSGVESVPGLKDPGKVMEFIKKAKVADW